MFYFDVIAFNGFGMYSDVMRFKDLLVLSLVVVVVVVTFALLQFLSPRKRIRAVATMTRARERLQAVFNNPLWLFCEVVKAELPVISAVKFKFIVNIETAIYALVCNKVKQNQHTAVIYIYIYIKMNILIFANKRKK